MLYWCISLEVQKAISLLVHQIGSAKDPFSVVAPDWKYKGPLLLYIGIPDRKFQKAFTLLAHLIQFAPTLIKESEMLLNLRIMFPEVISCFTPCLSLWDLISFDSAYTKSVNVVFKDAMIENIFEYTFCPCLEKFCSYSLRIKRLYAVKTLDFLNANHDGLEF